jgi:hypothetical protein
VRFALAREVEADWTLARQGARTHSREDGFIGFPLTDETDIGRAPAAATVT